MPVLASGPRPNHHVIADDASDVLVGRGLQARLPAAQGADGQVGALHAIRTARARSCGALTVTFFQVPVARPPERDEGVRVCTGRTVTQGDAMYRVTSNFQEDALRGQ